MAARSQYEELARQLSVVGAIKRGIARVLPAECPGGSAAVLTLLDHHGEMRISRLAELLSVDISVTSRHVAHVADRGWIERSPDPADKRSRILRLTPAGQGVLGDLNRRSTEMFARNLREWSDDEVGQLNTLLARLRDSFVCGAPCGCAPGRHDSNCRDRPYEAPDGPDGSPDLRGVEDARNTGKTAAAESAGDTPAAGGSENSYTRTPL